MRKLRPYFVGGSSLLGASIIFILPFLFIFMQSVKSRQESSRLSFTFPQVFLFWENLVEVVKARNYQLLTAYVNSITLTVFSVAILVIASAMVGYVLQRGKSRFNSVFRVLIYMGMMMPPAVVPTIHVLQSIGLFRTMTGMILIEVSYRMAFCVMMYRAFVASIPKDLDEAALIDGAKPWQIFFRVIFPLLKPVTVTIILVQSINIFNDFTNPLYYLPGSENVTVQLTIYNFQSMFSSQFNLLFMNILLVTIPPLILFIFFNRQIVAGMTTGAVKG